MVPHGIGIGIGRILLLVLLVLLFGVVVVPPELCCEVFGFPKRPDINPPEEDFDELELLEFFELELPGIDFGAVKLPDLKPPDEDLELELFELEDFELLNPLDLKLPPVEGFA